MALEWKTVSFFTQSLVQNDKIVHDLNVSTSLGCGGFLFFGQKNGTITVTDTHLTLKWTWTAHNRVTHLHFVPSRNVLISVGDEEEDPIPFFKVWDMAKSVQGTPMLSKSLKIQHGKVFPVTALAVLDSLNQIAIGLENGIVLLFKGDMSREKFAKYKVLYEDDSIITGLAFFEKNGIPFLYITSISRLVVVTTITGGKETPRILDDIGCELGNCLITPPEVSKPEMVIGKKEAVYFYGLEGRGPCFILQSEKSFMTWFQSYLVIVSSEPFLRDLSRTSGLDSSPPSLSPSNSTQFGSAGSLGTVLTIYDLKSKFIVFRSSFGQLVFDPKRGKDIGEGIIGILHGPSKLYVLTRNNHLYTLTEKDLETRLQLLYDQHLYNLALSMMSLMNVPSFHSFQDELETHVQDPKTLERIFEIQKRYADHLFDKGDFAGAVQHYIKTIPSLSPSYVILKFIDPCHIIHLTSYLQSLYESQVASSSHVNLLLNCYSKLKDDARVQALVQRGGFDLETGIRICKSSGYIQHALELGKLSGSHDWVIAILFEDLQDPSSVLAYICQLEESLVEFYMKKYGYHLLKKLPKEVTEVLIALCHKHAHPEDFIPFFANSRSWCIEFLEKVFHIRFESLEEDSNPSEQSRMVLSNTLFELYLEESSLAYKALALLKNPRAKLDLDQCLVLCQKQDYPPGILAIYEMTHRYKETLGHYATLKEFDAMKKVCKAHQEEDPHLWVDGLKLLVENTEDERLIMDFVLEIDRLLILEPLEIFEILCKNPKMTLGTVRTFLIQKMSHVKKELETLSTKTESYQKEIDAMQQHIQTLSMEPITFQSSKCEVCRQLLEIPCIHFLCRHSYHTRCLDMSGTTQECPRCAPERRILLELLKSQEKNARDHSSFLQGLANNKDPMSYLTDTFSKNVFSSQVTKL